MRIAVEVRRRIDHSVARMIRWGFMKVDQVQRPDLRLSKALVRAIENKRQAKAPLSLMTSRFATSSPESSPVFATSNASLNSF
jgi:hypothetical protein